MKKTLLILLALLIGISGCKKEEPTPINTDIDKITIYSLNDFHGNVQDDNGGLSRIGNYIIEQKNKNVNGTVVLAAGDMLQGSAISNMSKGKVVLEAMEEIGFNAMTIGNHEFDWGIETLESLSEKASFPFLAANIYEKATNQLVTWAKPYTIFDKGDVKIGVIGIIGKSLTEDISPSIISSYEFKNELEIVKEYTKKLRNELDVDIVIVSAHNNTKNDNQTYADLTGEYQIDAVINGHTHTDYNGEILGADGIVMPYVQSGSSGKYIGKIEIELDSNNKMKDGSSQNIRVSKALSNENTKLNEIIKKYDDETKVVSGEVIGLAGMDINRTKATNWAADVIKYYSGMQVGIINTGGIRADAFPIGNNAAVTVGKIWEIMPFDNIVKTVEMKAKMVVGVYPAGVQVSSNASISGGKLYIDGVIIDDDTMVTVATIDFLFDNKSYGFINGNNQVNTGTFFRDYLINHVREVCKDGGKWSAETIFNK
jgi:2',3'-cyclic-nucleotide 2'-phosphodiesterase/3'-nucleotidase